MTQKSKDKAEQPDANLEELSIDKPRLTTRASVDPNPAGHRFHQARWRREAGPERQGRRVELAKY